VYREEEIDIRGIILTVLRYKWLILGVTLGLAVAGFAVSKLLLPKQYQATALLVLSKPIYTTNLDPRIETSLQLPDSKPLTDLAKADDVVLELFQTPEAGEVIKKGETLKTFSERLEVTLTGLTQLRLSVTTTHPESAAKLANVWAEMVAKRLNDLFDVNENSLSQIEQQQAAAYQKWTETEQALLSYLPQNRSHTLDLALKQARGQHESYLAKINEIDLISGDIIAFEAQLAGQSQNQLLSIEESLGLITLYQRPIGGGNPIQIEVAGQGIMGEDYTLADARASLKRLSDSLASRRTQLVADLGSSEELISRLSADLEEANYQVNQLTVQRDLALSAYNALSSQQAETNIALAQGDALAKVASQALPPEEDVGPHSVLNAAAAGILGLVVSVFAIFGYEWWKSTSPAAQPLPAEPRKAA
jgi:uncharacterized protein involved in exopolysaccharide biosynthesis